MMSSTSCMVNDADKLSSSSSSEDASQPRHARRHTKQDRCPQPKQSAKESRSDFLVGFRWQMWQGLKRDCEFDGPVLRLVPSLVCCGDGVGAGDSGCAWQ